VYAAIGSRIRKGQLLAIISSPQVAEQHGKLHEAETRLSLAEENLKRVKRMENRVAILKGKADLDLATSNLAMEKQLFKEQISSRQALIAAQSDYDRAKAEYAFQNDIALNREIAAANSELRTAQAEMLHLKQGLIAQDAALDESGNIERDISIVQLHAPMSGIIVERFINAGAGVEAGKPIFTVADASSVWIIANVPESQVNAVRTGMDALIAPLAGSTESIKGVINYIDPRMNEDTRSARVRIEVQNSNQLLKLGMFAQVTIPIESQAPGKAQILIPADAVQQLPDRTIVFVPEDKEPGHFHVKEVDVGKEADGFRLVKAGLSAGDIVVTKGGFALKSKLLKAQFGGDND
jgi:cobalt-zinc-cadmium efflux system membrane fusion protein